MSESDREKLAEDAAKLTKAVKDSERAGARLIDLPAACDLLPPDPERPWRSGGMPAWVPAAADHLGRMLA